MSQTRSVRVIRDTAYLLTGQFVIGVVGIIASSWIARNLPDGELSTWPVCISLVAVVYTLGNLGLRDASVRMIPRMIAQNRQNEATGLLRTGLALLLVSNVAICCGIYLCAHHINTLFLKDEVSLETVRLLTVAVFWTASARHFESFLNAFQCYKMMAVSRTVENVIRPIAAVAFYWIGGINGMILALAIGPFVGCLISGRILLPYIRRTSAKMSVRVLLQHSAPYYVSGICAGAIMQLDYLIVGLLGSTQNLATYFVARKIVDYVKHINTYALDTMTPKIAEKAAEGRDALERTFTKCSRYFFLGAVPIYMGLAAIGRPLIVAYAGAKYSSAGLIFSILCFHLLLDALYALYRRNVLVAGNRWHPLLLDGFTAFGSVTLVAVLSVAYGGLGAAVAKVTAIVLVLPLAILLASRVLTPRHSMPAAALGISGGLITLIFGYVTQIMTTNVFWGLSVFPIGAVCYLLLLKSRLSSQDMDLMVGLIPSRMRQGKTGKQVQGRIARFFTGHSDVGTPVSDAS